MSGPADGPARFGLSDGLNTGQNFGFRLKLTGTDIGNYSTLDFRGTAIQEIVRSGSTMVIETVGASTGSISQIDGNLDLSGSLTLTGSFEQHSGLFNLRGNQDLIITSSNINFKTTSVVRLYGAANNSMIIQSTLGGSPGLQFLFSTTAATGQKLLGFGSDIHLLADVATGHPGTTRIASIKAGNIIFSASSGQISITGSSMVFNDGFNLNAVGRLSLSGATDISLTGTVKHQDGAIFSVTKHADHTTVPAAAAANSGSVLFLVKSGSLIVSDGARWIKILTGTVPAI